MPACNEAAVIERCLDRLSEPLGAGSFDVVVVVNGTSDDTAERVRRWAGPGATRVRLVELAVGSKPAAVRRGLAELGVPAGSDPVLVLDADVELDRAELRAVVEAVRLNAPVVAEVAVRVDASCSDPVVRRWAAVWTALPYTAGGVVGSGLLALSARGAARVGALPDVVNDDGWVRRQFPPSSRVSTGATLVVHAPRTARALVARRARVLLGNDELAALLGPDPERTASGSLGSLVRERRVSPLAVAVYAGTALAARLLAAYRVARGRRRYWAADATSRAPGPTAPPPATDSTNPPRPLAAGSPAGGTADTGSAE